MRAHRVSICVMKATDEEDTVAEALLNVFGILGIVLLLGVAYALLKGVL